MRAKNFFRIFTSPTVAAAAIRAHEIKRLRAMKEEIRASYHVRAAGTTVYFLCNSHLVETSSTYESVAKIQSRLNMLVEADYEMKVNRKKGRYKGEIEISFTL